VGVIAALISACTSTAKDLVSKLVAARVHPDVSTSASFLFAMPFYFLILIVMVGIGGESFSVSLTFSGACSLAWTFGCMR